MSKEDPQPQGPTEPAALGRRRWRAPILAVVALVLVVAAAMEQRVGGRIYYLAIASFDGMWAWRAWREPTGSPAEARRIERSRRLFGGRVRGALVAACVVSAFLFASSWWAYDASVAQVLVISVVFGGLIGIGMLFVDQPSAQPRPDGTRPD